MAAVRIQANEMQPLVRIIQRAEAAVCCPLKRHYVTSRPLNKPLQNHLGGAVSCNRANADL